MLQLQLADQLARQRSQELRLAAERSRIAHAHRVARRRQRAPVRVRLGWWLVARGLRLAVWDRHASAERGSATAAVAGGGRSLVVRP